MTLIHEDPRSGDRYEIDITDTGVFERAVRHVDGVGRNPLIYERLTAVPQPAQNAIQYLIWTKLHPTRP